MFFFSFLYIIKTYIWQLQLHKRKEEEEYVQGDDDDEIEIDDDDKTDLVTSPNSHILISINWSDEGNVDLIDENHDWKCIGKRGLRNRKS